MEENKQVVAEWKALNQPRLQEIKKANPDLYSAVNLALQYLNQKLGGEELPAEIEVVEEVVETTPMQTKQWTFDDLKDIKIFVNTPEKSRKFQELFLSLGGKWSSLDISYSDDVRQVNNTDKKYLITSNGVMLYYDTPKNFDLADNKEIYYEDIFSSQRPQKQLTKDDFLNKKIVVDTEEKSKKFQLLAYSLGLMWAGGENKTPILLDEKYLEISRIGTISYISYKDTFTQYSAEEIFYEDIFPESETTTTQTSTTSQEVEYIWPIETYPPKLKLPSWNLNFERNNGDRKSPTQSAGELRRNVNKLGQYVDYVEMILETKFRGNDGNWYAISVGKGGVWTWKETPPPPTQSTSFISTSSAQPTSAPVTNDKPEDLIGREIYFKGSYKIMGIIKVNPKTVRYKISNDKKNIELDIPKNAISSLLQGKVVGKAFLKDPKPAEVVNTTLPSENSLGLAAMSNTELKKLYDETYDARKEFSITDPEYVELGEQLVEIANEIDKRKFN